jgi:hypothetical protein
VNLGEALLTLKAKRSELVRLHELRENSFRFKEGGAKPEDDFATLTATITALSDEIRRLKMGIENTNHSRYIDAPTGKMSIAEAIHYIADIRSELACLQTLKGLYRAEERWGNESTTKYIFQMPQRELLEKINKLEATKVRMDAFLSSYNWKVDIPEK